MVGFHLLEGKEAALHLAHEAKRLRHPLARAEVLFYENSPSIVVGRYNKLAEWVNEKAAAEDCIPVLRRISGGGAVFHDEGTLCYSLLVPTARLDAERGRVRQMDYFRLMIAEGLAAAGINAVGSRVSDLSLNGRKISGNAARITKLNTLLHGTLLFEVDYGALGRYLPIPPDRPGISHEEFVTSLANESIKVSRETVMRMVSLSIYNRLGV